MISKTAATEFIRVVIGEVQSAGSSYLALLTSAPNAEGTLYNEVSTTYGYERVLVGRYQQSPDMFTEVSIGSDDSGSYFYVTNKKQVAFPLATGDWGTITHWGIFRTSTAGSGTCYYWGELTTSIAPTTDTLPLVRIGDITIIAR